MALAWPFRTRSPDRDRQTDAARLDRLIKAIDETSASVATELHGLEARYEATAANAAFLNEAIEDGEEPESKAASVDEMIETMERYRQRTGSLARQLDVLEDMKRLAQTLT
ncbi:MAG: hypothetical protein M9924_16300 [Rhizobiaceae bacterium]|nr:hypothetical protein [Rhizobiaceae bacterium]